MRFIKGLIIFLCFSTTVSAQDVEQWQKGKLTTIDEKTYDCMLWYNTNIDALRAIINGEEITLLPQYVISFSYKNKNFVTARHDLRGDGYLKEAFFELLYQGANLSLLFKKPSPHMMDSSPFANRETLNLPGVNYSVNISALKKISNYARLYLVNKQNKVFDYSKDTFYRLTADKKKLIKKYMKEEDINLNNRDELIEVIAYYNELMANQLEVRKD